MSEPKRATFVTVSSSVAGSSKASATGSDDTGANSSITFGTPKKSSKTIRIELELFEPGPVIFPAFNYAKLVQIEKKKKKKIAKVNGFADPFEDNDDDVARIAKELERKYGNAYAGKNSGIGKADCYDKGAGYDENDTFIDNTEAYDENVPDEIDTDRGGFYINSGSLVFKPLANFERPEDALRMPKPSKRALSTSSDSSGDEMEPSAKVSSKNNGHVDKKVKVQEKSKKKDDGNEAAIKEPKKMVKTTTVKDMLRAKRDSMRNMLDGGVLGSSDDAGSRSGSSDESDSDDEDDEDDDEDDDGEDEDEDEDDEKMETDQPGVSGKKDSANGGSDEKLPNNLPAALTSNIQKLIDSAKSSSVPKVFFDSKNTELLYQIDTLARSVGGVARKSIYNYLERFLPCTKQTMQMRAKKCRVQREEAKVNKVVKQLKLAVDAVMPGIQAEYEAECQRITELRAKATREGESKEAIAALKMPKRRFQWTETTRSLIVEIFHLRNTSYLVMKPRKEKLDEFVHRYIREHVLKVWPDGYMRVEELVREYEKSHKSSKKPKDKDTAVPNPSTDTALPTVQKKKTNPSTLSSNQATSESASSIQKLQSVDSLAKSEQAHSNSTHSTSPPPNIQPPPAHSSSDQRPSRPASNASGVTISLSSPARSHGADDVKPNRAEGLCISAAYTLSSSTNHKADSKTTAEMADPRAILQLSTDSSSSDDVEFVSEVIPPVAVSEPPQSSMPPPRTSDNNNHAKSSGTGPRAIQVNKNKYMQRNGSNSPYSDAPGSGSADEGGSKSEPDVDVEKLMFHIKEMQNFQSNANPPSTEHESRTPKSSAAEAPKSQPPVIPPMKTENSLLLTPPAPVPPQPDRLIHSRNSIFTNTAPLNDTGRDPRHRAVEPYPPPPLPFDAPTGRVLSRRMSTAIVPKRSPPTSLPVAPRQRRMSIASKPPPTKQELWEIAESLSRMHQMNRNTTFAAVAPQPSPTHSMPAAESHNFMPQHHMDTNFAGAPQPSPTHRMSLAEIQHLQQQSRMSSTYAGAPQPSPTPSMNVAEPHNWAHQHHMSTTLASAPQPSPTRPMPLADYPNWSQQRSYTGAPQASPSRPIAVSPNRPHQSFMSTNYASAATQASPNYAGAPQVSPHYAGAPQVSPNYGGAPQASPNYGGAPQASPNYGGAPQASPNYGGSSQASPHYAVAPQASPSYGGAPQASPAQPMPVAEPHNWERPMPVDKPPARITKRRQSTAVVERSQTTITPARITSRRPSVAHEMSNMPPPYVDREAWMRLEMQPRAPVSFNNQSSF